LSVLRWRMRLDMALPVCARQCQNTVQTADLV